MLPLLAVPLLPFPMLSFPMLTFPMYPLPKLPSPVLPFPISPIHHALPTLCPPPIVLRLMIREEVNSLRLILPRFGIRCRILVVIQLC